jgi:hypothetical protein
MGVLASKIVNDQLVLYDSSYAHRWLDAYGPNVVKWIEDGVETPYLAANQLACCETTVVSTGVGDSVANVQGAFGGGILITTGDLTDDGFNIQLNGASFKFGLAWPAYFGMRMKSDEATQDDFLFGFGSPATTDLLGGVVDGIYFLKIDGSTSVAFVVEKDSVAATVAGVQTFAADTYYTYEIVYDGTVVSAYINGVLVASVAVGNLSFPNDEYLTPGVHFITGEDANNTMTIDWVRAIQLQTM